MPDTDPTAEGDARAQRRIILYHVIVRADDVRHRYDMAANGDGRGKYTTREDDTPRGDGAPAAERRILMDHRGIAGIFERQPIGHGFARCAFTCAKHECGV